MEEYNDIPVFYCKDCLALNIKTVAGDLEYCDRCGSTDIGNLHIEAWQGLYRKRYGFDYLTSKLNRNGRDKEPWKEAHL